MTAAPSPVVTAAGAAATIATAPATIDIDTGGAFTDAYVVGPHGAVQVKAKRAER